MAREEKVFSIKVDGLVDISKGINDAAAAMLAFKKALEATGIDIDTFGKLLESNRDKTVAISKDFGVMLKSNSDVIETFALTSQEATVSLTDLMKAEKATAEATKQNTEATKESTEATQQNSQATTSATEATQEYGRTINIIKAELKEAKKVQEDAVIDSEPYKQASERVKELSGELKQVQTSLKGTNEEIASVADDSLFGLRKQLKEAQGDFEKARIGTEEWVASADRIKELNTRIAEVVDVTTIAKESAKDVSVAFGKIGDSADSSIGTIGAMEAKFEELKAEFASTTDAARQAELAFEMKTITKTIQGVEDLGEAVALGFNKFDLAKSTVEGLSTAVAAYNATLASVKDPDEKQALGLYIKKLEVAMAHVDQFAEAVVLGFNEADYASSTVEGLTVAIGAMTQKLGLASDQAERMEIQKEIQKIELALEQAQAKAKQGIFPPGSIGAIETDIEALTQSLRRVPAGTAEWKKIKKELEETQLRMDTLSMTAEDQKNLMFDLGSSVGSTFASGAGLAQSFAGENENLSKAMLAVEQAMAAVEFVRSAIETARLVRQKLIISQTQAQIQSEQELATASEGSAKATGNMSGALGGFGSAIKGIGQAIKANPIMFLASVLITIGTTLYALKDKFKPLQQAFNFIEDSVAGLIGGAKALFDNFGAGMDYLKLQFQTFASKSLEPFIGLINKALTLFGKEKIENPFGDVEENMDNLAKKGSELSNKLSEGFTKGADKSARLRILKEQETQDKLAKIGDDAIVARLEAEGDNEDVIFALKQERIAKEKALAVERLALERDLTDQEVAILKSGDAEKIAILTQTLQAREKLTDEQIEQIQKVQELDTQAVSDKKAEEERLRQEYYETLDAQLDIFNSQKDLELQRLADKKDKASQFRAIDLELAKEEEAFRVAKLKGETVLETDIKAVREQAAADKLTIEKEAAQATAEINIAIEAVRLERRKAELEASKKQADQLALIEIEKNEQLAEIDREAAQAKLDDPDNAANIELLLQEQRVQAVEDANRQVAEVNKQFAEEEKAKRLALAELNNQLLQKSIEAQSIALQKTASNTKVSYEERNAALNEFYVKQNELVKANTELQLQQLGLTAEQIETFTTDGLDALKAQATGISEEVLKQVELIGATTESQMQANTETLANSLKEINNLAPLENFLVDKLGLSEDKLGKVKQLFSQGLSSLQQGVGAAQDIMSAMSDKIDAQLQKNQAKIDSINTELEKLGFDQAGADEQISSSNERIKELQAEQDATLERFLAMDEETRSVAEEDFEDRTEHIKALLAAEEEKKNKLKEFATEVDDAEALTFEQKQERARQLVIEQQAAQEEQKKLEREKASIQRKQAIAEKASAIFSIALSTAQAIIAALAPPPTGMGPIFGPIFSAVAGLLGAVQIGVIQAKPLPEMPKFATGGFTGDGDTLQPAGIVHKGEYVVPKFLVQNPQYRNDIMKLENARTRGYATGGMVEASGGTGDIQSLVKQGNDNIVALASRPSVVDVRQVTDTQNDVMNVQSKAVL